MPLDHLVTANLFADFPEDVVRIIFEWAAEGANWNSALVCRPVKGWVEPILYRVIVIKSWLPMERLVNTIENHPTKTQGFFSTHVKSFSVTTCSSIADFATIVKACSGLLLVELPLVIQRGGLGLDTIGPLWTESSLKRLLITPSAFYPRHRNFGLGIFRSITHLEFSYPEEDEGWNWEGFKDLMCLTHFTLNPPPSWYFVRVGSPHSQYQKPLEDIILPRAPRPLAVFIIFFPFPVGESAVAMLSSLDIRVVVALDREPEEHYQSSDSSFLVENTIPRGSVGTQNHWERAEEVILQRQNGLREWPMGPAPFEEYLPGSYRRP